MSSLSDVYYNSRDRESRRQQYNKQRFCACGEKCAGNKSQCWDCEWKKRQQRYKAQRAKERAERRAKA